MLCIVNGTKLGNNLLREILQRNIFIYKHDSMIKTSLEKRYNSRITMYFVYFIVNSAKFGYNPSREILVHVMQHIYKITSPEQVVQ